MAIKTVQMRAEWTENPGEFYRELGLSMAACLALVREACMLHFISRSPWPACSLSISTCVPPPDPRWPRDKSSMCVLYHICQ